MPRNQLLGSPYLSQLPDGLDSASNWRPEGADDVVRVDSCISQQTPEHCKSQFSPRIGIVIIITETLKMVFMLYTTVGLNDMPMMTIGDAIAPFLHKEDHTIKNCCLISMLR